MPRLVEAAPYPEASAIGFLGGARPGTDELVGTRELQVPPIDDAVLLQLLLRDGLQEGRARQIAAHASGLPGVALLAAQFADDPRPIEAAIFDLVRELQRPEREILATLWVAGRPVSVHEVAIGPTSSLLRRGLLVAQKGTIDLHDALRGAIGKALDEDWLRAAQLRKAMDPASDVSTRVSALLAAGDEEGARALAPKAADGMFRKGAFQRSAELYELATREGANPSLRERYALALDSAQRHEHAAEVWNEMACASTGDAHQEFLLARARSLLSARRISLGREARLGLRQSRDIRQRDRSCRRRRCRESHPGSRRNLRIGSSSPRLSGNGRRHPEFRPCLGHPPP